MNRNRIPENTPALVGPSSTQYRLPQVNGRQPQGAPLASAYHHHPLPTSGYGQLPPPGYVDAADILAQKITSSIQQVLGSHQAHSDARMNRLENNLQSTSTEISKARQEARTCVGEIAEVLRESHRLQTARLVRMENILGMGADMKAEKTLLHRFDLLSFSVEELLERIKDPEANRESSGSRWIKAHFS